jgi:hypothetical protein
MKLRCRTSGHSIIIEVSQCGHVTSGSRDSICNPAPQLVQVIGVIFMVLY